LQEQLLREAPPEDGHPPRERAFVGPSTGALRPGSSGPPPSPSGS
jgi:hypothetical protein